MDARRRQKGGDGVIEATDLWDWRRSVADLYYDVRSRSDVKVAWRLWCDRRAEMFQMHPQSPIEPAGRMAFDGPAMFPYDPAFRFLAELVPAPSERLNFATGADGNTIMRAFARTDGLRDGLGTELTLYWIEGYGGGVFLPFTDATCGTETYGGGRYLLDTIKGADLGPVRPGGMLFLDFNFSYFPSCAYSSRYVCPLAPSTNRLPRPVRAGERLAAKQKLGSDPLSPRRDHW
jgi:uncharacterized protein (DUF1684 family)